MEVLRRRKVRLEWRWMMDSIKHDLTANELSREDAPGLHWG